MQNIGILKTMIRTVDIPVITGGRVRRMEDVKKYLYAGAKAVYLNASVPERIDLLKEVSDRFGSEKILVLAGYGRKSVPCGGISGARCRRFLALERCLPGHRNQCTGDFVF